MDGDVIITTDDGRGRYANERGWTGIIMNKYEGFMIMIITYLSVWRYLHPTMRIFQAVCLIETTISSESIEHDQKTIIIRFLNNVYSPTFLA